MREHFFGRQPSEKRSRSHRLAIVDRQSLVRAGLRATLSEEEGLCIVGEAAESREALELCYRVQPDLMLMELCLPGEDGVAAIRDIQRQFSRVHVLALCVLRDPNCMWEAIKAGASGYVLKDVPQSQLLTAIWKVLGGELALTRSLTNELLKRLASNSHQVEARASSETVDLYLAQPLTSRELEVLKLLALGRTNRQIARSLFIGEGTVKNHVQRLRNKLGAPDRTCAAVRAIEMGLMTFSEQQHISSN